MNDNYYHKVTLPQLDRNILVMALPAAIPVVKSLAYIPCNFPSTLANLDNYKQVGNYTKYQVAKFSLVK
ncbi:hypothetical protein [Scytonema sp. PRP1]|uniref:hypothetical protein n=1 Tax=Scytonema sp. PRP1 TaxID=3120513 RepID=UPI002FD73448